MDNNLYFQASETASDDLSSLDKLTQSYLLLKKKMCGTHDLIRQYNDKVKECDRLKADLDAASKQTKRITCNYNSTLAKVIKLELQNTEYKKNIESLTNQVNDHTVKSAADQQHIHQLICKVKDVEGQQSDKIMQYDLEKSSLQVKVKELEQELKSVKKSFDTKMKKMEKKVPVENVNKVKMKDFGMNTSFTDDVKAQKPQVTEKYVMTDETYTVKDDIYPIFCAKCEVLLEPPPVEKICEIMTESCPRLIERISSPPKKAPSPIQISTNMNNEQCKTETITTSMQTPPLHVQNQNSHSDFISANLLPSLSPVELNRSDYCNNFPQPSNLINQSTYYIGSTPVNPLLTNSSKANQNKHCEDMSTVASSLSIITSLQKRIDTLEVKLKRKFNKRKLTESSNCWQHKHPNACCMYDMNNSMQMNFIELWKKMTDICDSKQKNHSHARMRDDKKSKLSRLKMKRKLKNARTGSWKVESVAKKIEQSPLRKRSKKRKHRRPVIINKPDVSLNNTVDLEKSFSDTDTISCSDSFDDATANNMDVGIDNRIPQMSNSKASCPFQPVDADETESAETVRNLIESNKSGGGETDSGILSDSIESQKLVQFEADIGTRSSTRKCRNMAKAKSSMKNAKSAKLEKPGMSPIKVVSRLNQSERSIEKDTDSTVILQADEHSENMAEMSQVDSIVPEANISTNCTRKRKRDEAPAAKCSNRGQLLKKLRNLKKNINKSNKCQNVSGHLDVHNEHEPPSISHEQTHLETDDEYVPRKRSRVAHTPKSTVTEENNSANKSLRLRKTLAKNVADTKENSEINESINDVEEMGVTQTSCVNLNESFSITKESAKEDTTDLNTDNSQTRFNSRSHKLNSDISKENFCKSNGTENNSNSHVSAPNIKDTIENNLKDQNLSFTDLDISGHSDTFTKFSLDDSFEKVMELNEIKTELNGQCTNLAQKYDNSLRTKATVTDISDNTDKLSDCTTKPESTVNEHSVDHARTIALDSNDTQTNDNSENSIEENIQRGQAENTTNNPSAPLLNPQSTELTNAKESDIKETHDDNSVAEVNFNTVVKPESHSPLNKLRHYIKEYKSTSKNCKNKLKKFSHIRAIADKFIKKQLQRLVDSDWLTSTHWDVIAKLSPCSDRIIAKGIVDFLSTDRECNKKLDKTHTPPAPLMTKSQQRIAALLVDLEESKPMVFHFVQAGIEHRIFRLNRSTERSILESLARMYTVLARIKKDREKVRIFCCDALYCLGLHATTILYTVFTCWPEVLPNSETNKEILPKCMAHLVTTQQAVGEFPKLHALKNLVTVFYKYKMGTLSKDLLADLLTAFQENSCNGVETAIILLAKREGTTWTYKNIIRGALLPMIVTGKLPNTYDAFYLLGNLMRVFPVDDKDNSVGEIVKQLCDLLNSGEVLGEQQEGVVSALLSLSRHKFDEVARNVMKWTPTAPIHDQTAEQINGLFKLRTVDFWRSYLQKCSHKTHKKSKT